MKVLCATAIFACLLASGCSDKPKGLPKLGDISAENPMSRADALANLFEVAQRTCADVKWQKAFYSSFKKCVDFSKQARPACEKTALAQMPEFIRNKDELHNFGAAYLDCLLPP